MTNKITDKEVFAKYQQLSESAKKRGLEFNLTYTSVKNILRAKRCYYTRVEFREGVNGLKKTVDRIDSSKGYVIGNVVACTQAFNIAKSNIEKMDKAGVKRYLRAVKKFADKLENI